MKTLFLMRHAKSSRKKPLPDHDRPLKKRGRKTAERVGRQLAEEGRIPDLILSSDAQRAVETAMKLRKGLQRDEIPIRTTPSLYEADAGRIFDMIGETEEEIQSVLVIGHNPGISEAAVWASGEEKYGWMPTGAVLGLYCTIEKWREIGKRAPARTLFYLLPKSLEKNDQ